LNGSDEWRLISDCNVVGFLRALDRKNRDKRLLLTVGEAMQQGLKDLPARTCKPEDPIAELAPRMTDTPYLVLAQDKRLCGIITAFDLL
jgi:CBS-domain-containing membrane protein